MRRLLLLAAPLLAVAATGRPAAADPVKPNYADDVTPILRQHCFGCHGNDKQKGGLNLATFAALSEGGSSGVVVVSGNPDKSRLYTLSAHTEEPKMPPNGKIPDAQLATLKLWIEQGGRENAGSKAVAVAVPKTDIGLKSVVKGRPEGPPPMPLAGKLTLDPVVRARRAGAVLALAASPWAPLAAVGGQKQVLLYNTDSGLLVGVLPFEHGQVNSLKFSRNAKLLLAAGGRGGATGKAVLFNVETGAKVTEVGNETDAILAADISADQTQIAVGGPSKIVRVYATADGSVVREIKKHTDWVTAVEYSPDGVLLATGDRNGGLFAWEAFTGREFFGLRGHTAMVTDLSWRDDSNCLASSSEDGTVRLWEMENGNQLKSWNAHGGGAWSVRFSHDGKLASTGRDKVTKLWDQGGTAVKQFEPLPDIGLRAAVTHDNAKVLAGDWSGVVKAWTAADAKVSATLDANPLPLGDRIKLAQADVAAAEAKLKAATDSLAAVQKRATDLGLAHQNAQAAVARVNEGIAAANKVIADGANTAKTAKAQWEAAKAAADKQGPAVLAAETRAKELEAQSRTAADAAKAAANEAGADSEKAKKAAAAAAETAKLLAGAQKTLADLQVARKTATDQEAAAQKAYNAVAAEVAEAQKRLADLQPKLKPAADAVPPAKKAADEANTAVGPATAARNAADAALAAARQSLAALQAQADLKSQPPPKK